MNTGNRVLWIAIGLVLTAIGVLGTLASLNRLPFLAADRLLLGADAARNWHRWGGWAPLLTIIGGLLLALLGFLLLRAQIRGRGGAPMADLVLPTREPTVLTVMPADSAGRSASSGMPADSAGKSASSGGPRTDTVELAAVGGGQSLVETVPGRTQVTSKALHHALTRDLQSDHHVRRAAVRLVGDRARPEVLVRLAVSADTDVSRLRSHVDGALDRFAVTSGVRPHLHDVVVSMADQSTARVR